VTELGQARLLGKLIKAFGSKLKKDGFYFYREDKEKTKNKIYNIHAFRVLRGVIKLLLLQHAQNKSFEPNLYRSFSAAASRSGTVSLPGR
jgi:hypothetical protein